MNDEKFDTDLQTLNLVFQKHYENFQKQLILKEIEFHKSMTTLWKARSDLLQKSSKSIWFECFANHPVLRNYVTEDDVQLFQYLWDIQLQYNEDGFELFFKFHPNPYFKNNQVVKKYQYIEDSEEDYPKLDIELPEIEPCDLPGVQFGNVFATTIDWEKNILTKKVTKKQRNKHTNQTRTIVSEIILDSFFHYFKLHPNNNSDEVDIQEQAQMDIDIADAIKDDIIPNLYLWYSGEFDDTDDNESVEQSFGNLNLESNPE
eukprot:NODE_102_length_19640_cov_1.308735.p11 type:complete len:260 gc:universal NODE_102_length_19640_cov_1.308735:7964-7185(-)